MVSWANAWLLGLASLDAADAAAGGHGPPAHRVLGVPGEEGPVPWSIAWGRLRALGVQRYALALPVPGDLLGLNGPAGFNAVAVAAGVAVIATGDDACFGMVPDPGGAVGCAWRLTVLPVPRAGSGPSQLNEAQRDFDEVVRAAATDLDAMGLAREHPGATAAAQRCEQELRYIPTVLSAPATRLLARASRLGALVSLALSYDGAALTSAEARGRRAVLGDVERASRRAVVAAYSSVAGPDR